jgi:hypothetical protein
MSDPAATIVQLPERDTKELQQLVSRTKIAVDALTITNDADYTSAGDTLKLIAERRDVAWKFLETDINLAHKLHKSLTEKRALLVKPWDGFRATVETAMRAYRAQQAKMIEAAQKIQQERADALIAASQQEAQQLKAQGRFGEAREVVSQAEHIVQTAPEPTATIEKVKGVAEAESWSGVCDDPLALLKAVADGRVNLMWTVRVAGKERTESLFGVNQRVLDMMASRMREEFNWPGCSARKNIDFRVSKS